MEIKKSLEFKRDWYELSKRLTRDQRAKLYSAIFEYGFYGTSCEVGLDSLVNDIFKLIKSQIKECSDASGSKGCGKINIEQGEEI